MDELNKPKVSVGVIIISAVLAAVVFGGGVYAYQSNKANKDQEALKSQITALETEKANLEKQVADSTTATATTTTPATTTDETANWKTYENTANFYSFKYPDSTTLNSWTGQGDDSSITADAATIHAYELGKTGYIVEISDLSTNQTITDYISSNWKDKTMAEVVVAGTNGYKVEVGSVDYYYVEKNGKKIQINIVKNNSTASKIFTTFKFSK